MAYKNKEDQVAFTRQHYLDNKEKYKANAKSRTVRVRDEIRAYILAFLLAHPCMTCGESDPIVLEFDHRDRSTKEFDVSQAQNRQMSFKRIQAEIDKCDVLCANCHRRRTYAQMGWKSKG